MKLNDKQKQASEILKGNLLIIASAGTGKTTTIVERYINLVNNNVSPEEIMMTTFTNKSAKDMMNKIEKKTNKISPYIGTMHSLFLRILRNHSKEAFNNKTYTLLTDQNDQKKIIKNILNEEGIDSSKNSIKYFLSFISKFKSRGIFAEDLKAGFDLNFDNELTLELIDDEIIYVDPSLRNNVNKIYKKYQEYLNNNFILDFDEVLLLTYKLLTNNPLILDYYKSKFKSIMVDEAQDLNVIQIKILDLLKNDNLCLIGDDCQNIYGWRGSSNELIFNFEENENKIFLEENYRSGENIILLVNKIISSMEKKVDKKLISTRKTINEIEIEGMNNSLEEVREVSNKIRNLISRGETYENISILFRTNFIGKFWERELLKLGIPSSLAKSVSFLSREEIKDTISFIRLYVNPYSLIDSEKILSLIPGLGKVKAKRFIEFLIKNNFNFFEGIENIEILNLGKSINEELKKLNIKINEEDLFDIFLKEFGYETYLEKKYFKEKDKFEDKIENILAFKELFLDFINQQKSLVNFLDSLMEIDKQEKTKNAVNLSTIHAAKGLEWKHVFLVSCNEKILPFYKNELTPKKRDSELRLFYVATSRARDTLNISYSFFNSGNYFLPSQFLEIIYDSEFKSAFDL